MTETATCVQDQSLDAVPTTTSLILRIADMNSNTEEVDFIEHSVEDALAREMEQRDEEINHLSDDLTLLHELLTDCADILFEQGVKVAKAARKMQDAEELTNGACQQLKEAEKQQQTRRRFQGTKVDACILLVGATLGSLGWIGGPWIGVPTTAAGIGGASAIIVLKRRLTRPVKKKRENPKDKTT